MTIRCQAIAYPAKKHEPCHDAQCGTGTQCFDCGNVPNGSRLASCCPAGQMPTPGPKGRYPCQRQGIDGGQFCQWSCCASPLSVPCGTGCCRPSTHGYPHKCGKALGSHGSCCVQQGASPEEQLQDGCCIRGEGRLCTSGPPHKACCLWTQGDTRKSNPDPHSPCQPKNCSFYEPCATPEGYDCRFFGQRVCCLRSKSGHIAEEDTCQRSPGDCQSRWRPCPSGVGSNCANSGIACCLGEASCSPDCSHYRPTEQHSIALTAVCAIALAVCVCAALWWRQRRRQRQAESAARRPVALVLANSDYRGVFVPLPFAHKDGQAMCQMLSDQGYEVINDWDVSRSKMLQRCRQLVNTLGGCKGPVVPICFMGHGVEVAGMQYLVPVDATGYDPQSLVPLSEFLQLPQTAHLPSPRGAASAETVRSALYACFLDICRLPVPDDAAKAFGAAAAKFPSQRSSRRQADASCLFVLKACQAGGVAQETPDGHGYFTKAVLTVPRDATLQEYADQVMEQVKRETEAARLLRPTLQVQQPCLESECAQLRQITLADPGLNTVRRQSSSRASTRLSGSSSSSLLELGQ